MNEALKDTVITLGFIVGMMLMIWLGLVLMAGPDSQNPGNIHQEIEEAHRIQVLRSRLGNTPASQTEALLTATEEERVEMYELLTESEVRILISHSLQQINRLEDLVKRMMEPC